MLSGEDFLVQSRKKEKEKKGKKKIGGEGNSRSCCIKKENSP